MFTVGLLSERGGVLGICLCVSDFCIGYSDGKYSGLTKTSTALPRLSSKRTIL
ncbi:AzlC family protein [Neisseria meningitidis]|nr:AzlC family protein [Neisseria meningitidis]